MDAGGTTWSNNSRAVLILTAALMTLSAVMVMSASTTLSAPSYTWRIWDYPELRQVAFAGGALVVLLIAAALPYRMWLHPRRLPAWLVLLTLTVALLAATPFVGPERNGARRWLVIPLGGGEFSFQPSELAKFALVLFLAAHAARPSVTYRTFRGGLLSAVVVVAVICGLIGSQDFGTGVLLLGVAGLLLLIAGASWWRMALLSVPAVAAAGWLVISEPYRIQRLLAFLNPWDDPEGIGYHPIQSMVAISSGGWRGVGLGAGLQKYGYLPEDRTDFIFAVICEELGFVGGVLVILLFALLVWQGFKAFRRCGDRYGQLLAVGITLTLGLQAAMNIAVVTVCVPTKGIGLPFVSAGGSGLLVLSLAAGTLAAVAARPAAAPAIEAPT
jgi:cell division protein FtsW